MEPSDGEFEVVSHVACPSLAFNVPGTTYTLIKLPEDQSSGQYTYPAVALTRNPCVYYA